MSEQNQQNFDFQDFEEFFHYRIRTAWKVVQKIAFQKRNFNRILLKFVFVLYNMSVIYNNLH